MRTFLTSMLFIASISAMGQYVNYGNTAFDYCRLLGYELVVDQSTNKTYCLLPNGEKVNPWDFFKGKIGQDYSYCAKKGYSIRTKQLEDNGAYYAIPICDKKSKSESLMVLLSKDPKYKELFSDNSGDSGLFDTVLVDNIVRRIPPPVCKGPDTGYSTNFDWNNKDGHDYDNDPENQGEMRICYAMVAASIAETMYAYENNLYIGNSMPNFSQAFIAFMGSFTKYPNPYIWYGIRGTYGNLYGYHYEPLQKMCCNGIVDEDEFPWAVDSTGYTTDTVFTSWGADRYRFNSWDSVSSDVTDIKDAVKNGPVKASIVYSEFLHDFYDGGILKGSTDTLGDHAVTIVGWYYDEFEEQCEYWKVKNSFGPEWPNGNGDGYLKVSSYGSHAINHQVYKLINTPVSFEGNDLAYNPQTILDLPNGAGTIHHRPDPYTLFNGFNSSDQWEWGGSAELSPKSDVSGEATIIYRVVFNGYPQYNSSVDPDTLGYYEKKVWAGNPVAPYVTGSTLIGCYEPTWYYAWANSPSGLATAESFTWELSNGLELLNTYSNPARIRIQATGTGDYEIKCIAINDIGSDTTNYSIEAFCVAPMINVFPNPASTEINVQIETDGELEPDFVIDLIDSGNKKWKTRNTKNRTTTISVNDVPNGSYIVKVSIFINGQKVEEKHKSILII